MKIDGTDPIAHIKKILERTSAGQVRQSPASHPAGHGDRLEVSGAAREFHAVREAALREPEVRTELVERFRARVEAGTYDPDARIVAQKILESLREMSGA